MSVIKVLVIIKELKIHFYLHIFFLYVELCIPKSAQKALKEELVWYKIVPFWSYKNILKPWLTLKLTILCVFR